MDSFASQSPNASPAPNNYLIPTEETPIASNKGAPSTSSSGIPVAKYRASTISNLDQLTSLGITTIAIHPPGNQPGFNVSILSEAILGPYTRSRAQAHQRAFRTGIKREQRLVEKKMGKGMAEYNRRHRQIHGLMHSIHARKTRQRHSNTPDFYTAAISAEESQLAYLGIKLRETRADYATLRVQWVSLKKLIQMNVLVREGQLEAIKLLLELADVEGAHRQLYRLLIEVENRS